MEQALFALPIIPGKTEAARAFLREAGGPRLRELAECGQNIGVSQEVWALQQTSQGDLLIAYLTAEDIGRAFTVFASSQDAFDVWFKQKVQEMTGADLNRPPSGPISEILTDTRAGVAMDRT